MTESRLPHGYTNNTQFVGAAVEKVYREPNAMLHARTELACLTALHGVLPVPAVLEVDVSVPCTRLTRSEGTHGQELIDAGNAPEVLRLVARALHTLQGLPPETVPGLDGSGPVIVHGDFGPQNMLFDLAHGSVTCILDWESAHRGDAVEDLAWAEWIVRMHHPAAVDALDELFEGAEQRPSWTIRHAAMIDRVKALLASCQATGMQSEWPARLARTEQWSE